MRLLIVVVGLTFGDDRCYAKIKGDDIIYKLGYKITAASFFPDLQYTF